MFQNNLNPPNPLKVLHNWLLCSNQKATMNYHDSRWRNNEQNHLDAHFSSWKPLLEDFRFISIKDYPTHEGMNSHMASVLVNPLTSWLSTVRTLALRRSFCCWRRTATLWLQMRRWHAGILVLDQGPVTQKIVRAIVIVNIYQALKRASQKS